MPRLLDVDATVRGLGAAGAVAAGVGIAAGDAAGEEGADAVERSRR